MTAKCSIIFPPPNQRCMQQIQSFSFNSAFQKPAQTVDHWDEDMGSTNGGFKSPFDITTCARPNILKLQPYRCAREWVESSKTSPYLHIRRTKERPPATTKIMGRTCFSTQTSYASIQRFSQTLVYYGWTDIQIRKWLSVWNSRMHWSWPRSDRLWKTSAGTENPLEFTSEYSWSYCQNPRSRAPYGGFRQWWGHF